MPIDSILDYAGCKLIRFKTFDDNRGSFFESFNDEISRLVGFWPAQENISVSKKNVVRGLHIQNEPPAAKLIRVIKGKILDVAVDCRRESENFGSHVSVELNDSFSHWFLVPAGFAHGFVSLEEGTVVNYFVSERYSKSGDLSIFPFDRDLGIDWKITRSDAILSQKDENAMSFGDFKCRQF
jgi:dTDP-4-dehydrorhamnose 3,5-epimerase